MRKQLVLLSSCLATLAACSKSDPPQARAETSLAETATPSQIPEEPLDACSLLTNDEIQTAMGEALKETKADRQVEEGLTISQCNFALGTPLRWINLRVVQRSEDAKARNPRQVWQETIGRDGDEAEKRKKAPQERVPNLGDEAFWTGGPKTGGLYVLKGNRFFRLHVGGEANQAVKIEKGTQLARSILQRL